jgi:hypothetical protein
MPFASSFKMMTILLVPHLLTSRLHHEGSHEQKENSEGLGEPRVSKTEPIYHT